MRTETLLITVNTMLLVKLAKLTHAVIHTASSTLAIFEPDKNEFLGLLLRLALSDSSPSSVAVLQSALALSSFHRQGLQASVFRFKARALRTLVTSSKHCVESSTAVQHIAASMILCHLEVCSSMGLCLLFEQPLTSASDAWNAKHGVPMVL
jgi:hypothetical protein